MAGVNPLVVVEPPPLPPLPPGVLPRSQLLRFATPDETAADFFARQATEALPTGVFFVDAHAKLRPGNVLEVAGPTASGKTELLTQMAARFLSLTSSPSSSSSSGGNGGGGGGGGAGPSSAVVAVVYVDLDCKFDPLRLVQLLADGSGAAPSAQLDRFHLVRCRSSAQLLATLATLPQRLAAARVRDNMRERGNGWLSGRERRGGGPFARSQRTTRTHDALLVHTLNAPTP